MEYYGIGNGDTLKYCNKKINLSIDVPDIHHTFKINVSTHLRIGSLKRKIVKIYGLDGIIKTKIKKGVLNFVGDTLMDNTMAMEYGLEDGDNLTLCFENKQQTVI